MSVRNVMTIHAIVVTFNLKAQNVNFMVVIQYKYRTTNVIRTHCLGSIKICVVQIFLPGTTCWTGKPHKYVYQNPWQQRCLRVVLKVLQALCHQKKQISLLLNAKDRICLLYSHPGTLLVLAFSWNLLTV